MNLVFLFARHFDFDILFFTDEVDEFVVQTLMQYQDKSFRNVAADDLDLLSEDEKKQTEENQEAAKDILTFIQETLGDKVKEVRVSKTLRNHPVCLVPEPGMSFEMEKYMKRMNPEFNFPSQRVLELNPEHAAVQAMEKAMVGDTQKARDYAALLCGQALLLADLPLPDPAGFAQLVCKLMN